jgi:phosphoglycolate phosphatase-like HAD superfamily hydrolase
MRENSIIVWDLDGTLSCGKHRLHLMPSIEDSHLTHSWDQFNLAAGDDDPIEDNIKLLNNQPASWEIIILTGRCDVARAVTVEWLKKHRVHYDGLIMRKQSDHRTDIEYKEEELRKIGLNNILCAFDDLEHVAKHMRSIGVTCHLVTHYDEQRLDTTPREEKSNEK